jgi:DNA-binding IclR family transcriptional regulator
MEQDARLMEYVERNPNATFDDITEALGIPRSTASRRLTAAGWHKNGTGWERSA